VHCAVCQWQRRLVIINPSVLVLGATTYNHLKAFHLCFTASVSWDAKGVVQYCIVIVYQMHLIDYLITLVSVCLSVCLSTDRLSNDYVRNSLPIFTKFCMPLGNWVVSKAIVSETNRK